MAYARWGQGDVYVYKHARGGYVCMGCGLRGCSPSADAIYGSESQDDFEVDTPEEMLAHLQEHVSSGDRVPHDALSRLKKEINDEDKGGF
jgi:hypothetical protein